MYSLTSAAMHMWIDALGELVENSISAHYFNSINRNQAWTIPPAFHREDKYIKQRQIIIYSVCMDQNA